MAKKFIFDYPTPELIKDYNDLFDNDFNGEDKHKDDEIFDVFNAMPNNTEVDEVLAKVTILNAFYGTQINNIELLNVARDIVAADIDCKIHGEQVDINVVNEIAYSHHLYSENLYSFASKYCSFHNPERFPIADSLSKGMLYYMNTCENNCFKFFSSNFYQYDLNNYINYYKVYRSFIEHFKLGNISYKKIDKYLWKYAKTRIKKGDNIKYDSNEYYLDRLI